LPPRYGKPKEKLATFRLIDAIHAMAKKRSIVVCRVTLLEITRKGASPGVLMEVVGLIDALSAKPAGFTMCMNA
jgi:hypothetical protein